MSKPEIKPTIGGYEFTWLEGVAIIVSRLHVHNSDGRVTGELLIKNKTSTLYPQTQINFSADRTRNSLTKTLTDRYEKHDWQAIIDQLCYHVQEKARAGEATEELWSSEELKPPTYLVYPIVMANQPNVLFGPPESGKTQWAMVLALAMTLPWDENPLGLKVTRALPLWLDYEADRDTTLFNFTRIVRGANIGDCFLNYRRCRLPLADDIEAIANHMGRIGADTIIVDSAAKAAAGDLFAGESPTRFFTAIDQLKCTSIILAHCPKGEGKKSIYGSVFFEAYARSVWELRASPDGDTLNIGLWDNKANFRRKHDPMAFQLVYEPESITVTIQDIKTVEDFMVHLSTSSRILEALKAGSKSPKELKELLLDVEMSHLYVELSRMVQKKKLVKMGSGKEVTYGIATTLQFPNNQST